MVRELLEIRIISLIPFLFHHSITCSEFKNSTSPTRLIIKNKQQQQKKTQRFPTSQILFWPRQLFRSFLVNSFGIYLHISKKTFLYTIFGRFFFPVLGIIYALPTMVDENLALFQLFPHLAPPHIQTSHSPIHPIHYICR